MPVTSSTGSVAFSEKPCFIMHRRNPDWLEHALRPLPKPLESLTISSAAEVIGTSVRQVTK